MPEQIYLNEHSDVQAVCNAVRTQDVKDAYASISKWIKKLN
jgi:hypothetical protein